MSAGDFWASDLRSVFNFIEGRQDAESAQQRAEWERTRWLATVFLQPHLKKGTKMKPSDLIQFDWEKPKKTVSEGEKERQRIEEKWRKWDNEIKQKHGGQ